MKPGKYNKQESYINYPPIADDPSEQYDQLVINELRKPLEDEDIDPQYERNYNYLKRFFQKSCKELGQFEQINLIGRVGEFKFNSQFIDKIENVISELSDENGSRSMAVSFLDSFKNSIKNSYNNYIIQLNTALETSNFLAFKSIISSSPFIADVTDDLKELTMKAIANIQNEEVVDFLKIILPNIENNFLTKNKLMVQALESNNLNAVKCLLDNLKFSKGDIICLPYDEAFKNTTSEIVDTLITHLPEEDKSIYGNYYKAEYFRANKDYKNAIEEYSKIVTAAQEKGFNNIDIDRLVVVFEAYQHMGLCYQCIGKKHQAIEAFQRIIEDPEAIKLAEYLISEDNLNKDKIINIKEQAQDRKKALEEIQEHIKTIQNVSVKWKSDTLSISQKYMTEVQELLQKFENNIESPQEITKLEKDIDLSLTKIKLILTKSTNPKIVLAEELKDLDEIYKTLTANIPQHLQEESAKYVDSIQLIEDTTNNCIAIVKVLGEEI